MQSVNHSRVFYLLAVRFIGSLRCFDAVGGMWGAASSL